MRALKLPLTLQTRVGRRIALLFVMSALLPIVVLAVIGYAQVRDQLVAQATERLTQTAKNVGMGFLDRLTDADNALLDAAGELGAASAGPRAGAIPAQRLRGMFSTFAVVDGGETRVLWGEPPRTDLPPTDLRWLADGHHLLRVTNPGAQVWIVTRLDGGAQAWAGIDRAFLLRGTAERARIGATDTQVCVRAGGVPTPVFCQASATPEDLVTARWSVFLAARFGAPLWHVVANEPRAAILEPIASFRRTFLLTMLVVLGLVVLLSSVEVRRTLQPLSELRRGTRRLARRDFSGTVSVTSGDEFQDLAASFNRMAAEMDQHLRTMTAAHAIDRSALSSRRAVAIAEIAAGRLRDVLHCASVDVCLAGERPEDAWSRVRAAAEGAGQEGGTFQPAARDLDRLRAAHGRWLEGDVELDSLGPSAYEHPSAFLPLISHEELVGFIAVNGDGRLPHERLLVARQLCDGLAIGLSNARLIGRLNELSYGALSALARAVDANSPWTAGHSERVASLSLRIGRHIELPAVEMDTLRRGGLLHDIGKIGVPGDLIDFPGVLDPEALARVRTHPTLGAKILAPIAAFADAIPIVLYHHEKLDGTGYPVGLRGENIPFLARLLAVADVYDALVSQRPYRQAWSQTYAIETIRRGGGSHFDPDMVEAFLAVMVTEGDAARFAIPAESQPAAVPS
jgi:putative nucleotidyltransferase with HDIG domain